MEGEVIISSSKSDNIYIWEPQSLTVLAYFSDNCSTSKQSLAYTNNMLIAAQFSKTLLNYYTFGKEGPCQKSGVLEEISAIACTDYLLLGGSIHGSLYLWDLNSGEILHTFKPHHNRINIVAIDEFIISASEDATIKIFRTSNVVAGNFQVFQEISTNVLPVTSFFRLGRSFFTTSKDKSFNFYEDWELKVQKFYQTALISLEVNENNLECFLGGEDGSVCLYKTGEVWEVDKSPITNLKFTVSEQYLIASSQKIYVLNPVNGNKLKTFVMHTGLVNSVLCIPRPADFVSGSLSHRTLKQLKKTSQEEPGVIHFEFIREKIEESKEEKIEKNEANTEEIEKLKQANSILYRLWIEHCS